MCVQLDRGLVVSGERGGGVVEAAARAAGGLLSTTALIFFCLVHSKAKLVCLPNSFISVMLSPGSHTHKQSFART